MRGRGLVGSFLMVAASGVCLGQASAGPSATTWDIFGGASYVRTPTTSSTTDLLNRNATGWELSVSERPYEKAPWFGGTIEGGGVYSNSNYALGGVAYAESQDVYTLMGGPMVMLTRGRVQPFARAMFGAVFTTTAILGGLTNTNTQVRHFGYAGGGGVDFLVTPSWGARVQADWVRSQQSPTEGDGFLRASVGAVYRW